MPDEQEHEQLRVGHLLALMGGGKGVFDSSVPALVFIVVRLFTDLNTGIVAAVVAPDRSAWARSSSLCTSSSSAVSRWRARLMRDTPKG